MVRGLFRVGAVEILLEVCVAVAVGVLRRVARIMGFQAVPDLPRIGHPIVIGIRLCGRESVFRPAAHIGGGEDDARWMTRT